MSRAEDGIALASMEASTMADVPGSRTFSVPAVAAIAALSSAALDFCSPVIISNLLARVRAHGMLAGLSNPVTIR